MANDDQQNEIFLTAVQLRERWGSMPHATLARLLRNDPAMPRPSMRINRRRFFKLSEIVAYERRNANKAIAEPEHLKKGRINAGVSFGDENGWKK